MTISAKDLSEMLFVMREGGCSKLVSGDLVIEMAPAAQPKGSEAAFNDMPVHPDGRPLTDEDWMLAATEGIPMGPEPQTKKAS